MFPSLRKKLLSVIAGGGSAIAIAIVMLSGSGGLEGRVYVPYLDVVGVLTVCDGHTGSDIIRDKRYSDAECDVLTRADLKRIAGQIDPHIKVSLPDTTHAALYSFAYNVGSGAFISSTLLKLLNRGDIAGACSQLRRWIYAGGKPWRGLMTRRDVEREVCMWGVQ